MKRIVIIGAGPAGATAAYELSKNPGEYEIVVLEASDSIGGISRTVKHGSNRIDIGGHRFFSKDERVMQWWKEMLPYQGKPSKDDLILGRGKPWLGRCLRFTERLCRKQTLVQESNKGNP